MIGTATPDGPRRKPRLTVHRIQCPPIPWLVLTFAVDPGAKKTDLNAMAGRVTDFLGECEKGFGGGGLAMNDRGCIYEGERFSVRMYPKHISFEAAERIKKLAEQVRGSDDVLAELKKTFTDSAVLTAVDGVAV